MKPFWHIHHEVLLEWSDDIQERIDYIKAHKPPHEVETRLRLLKPVQGALPPKLVKARDAYLAYDKAWDAFGKDWDAYVKARAAFGKDWDAFVKASVAYAKAGDAYDKASVAYDKARDALDKAGDAFGKDWDAYDKAKAAYAKAYDECLPQIEALHALECPGCPWNGTTIFPETTLE